VKRRKKGPPEIEETVIELEHDFFTGDIVTVAQRVISLDDDYPGYDKLIIKRKPGAFWLFGVKRFKRKKRRKFVDEKD